MESAVSGDLFAAEDKRLTLKAVTDLNKLLRNAFGQGPCTCSRCKKTGNVELDYELGHTFSIGGLEVHRRFIPTGPSDVLIAISKAWTAFTKEAMQTTGILDINTVHEFVEPGMHEALSRLLEITGIAKDVDGQLEFQLLES